MECEKPCKHKENMQTPCKRFPLVWIQTQDASANHVILFQFILYISWKNVTVELNFFPPTISLQQERDALKGVFPSRRWHPILLLLRPEGTERWPRMRCSLHSLLWEFWVQPNIIVATVASSIVKSVEDETWMVSDSISFPQITLPPYPFTLCLLSSFFFLCLIWVSKTFYVSS